MSNLGLPERSIGGDDGEVIGEAALHVTVGLDLQPLGWVASYAWPPPHTNVMRGFSMSFDKMVLSLWLGRDGFVMNRRCGRLAFAKEQQQRLC